MGFRNDRYVVEVPTVTDPLIKSGSVHIEEAEFLRANTKKLTKFTLSGPAIERIADSELDELVVTDTIPLTQEAKDTGKIRQLTIAELLGETIERIVADQSVSSLYAE